MWNIKTRTLPSKELRVQEEESLPVFDDRSNTYKKNKISVTPHRDKSHE